MISTREHDLVMWCALTCIVTVYNDDIERAKTTKHPDLGEDNNLDRLLEQALKFVGANWTLKAKRRLLEQISQSSLDAAEDLVMWCRDELD